ncbi:oxygenase MpaB family protein [Patulibacter sp. NPDC049589]|uniref:oxygenase MpaB family protein n=1 Tax=Patulibacter sp. NPDC049589 TaxID=3154731 RepID=UPI00342149F7
MLHSRTARPLSSATDEAAMRDLGREALPGSAFLAAANVIMQLSRLPVGHGVAKSTVDSGRLDRRPLKRLRTTIGYLVVALVGDEHERTVMRDEVNRQHRQVRSGPDDDVAYNAFDPELQLWVAACLYMGFEQYLRDFRGLRDEEVWAAFYAHAERLGTTLQVREGMWPADREAFEVYWRAGIRRIDMDDVSRTFLQDLASMRFLPRPVSLVIGPLHRFLTLGFLPEPFRRELGLPWTPRHQRAFDRTQRVMVAVDRALPRWVRLLPVRLYERDVRRRIRDGRPIV